MPRRSISSRATASAGWGAEGGFEVGEGGGELGGDGFASTRADVACHDRGERRGGGAVLHGAGAVLQSHEGDFVDRAGEPCPGPRWSSAAQVFEAFVAAGGVDEAAQVIEHLQCHAERFAEAGDGMDPLVVGAGGDRGAAGGPSHQGAGLEAGGGLDDAGDFVVGEQADVNRDVEGLPVMAAGHHAHRFAIEPALRGGGAGEAVDETERGEIHPVAGVERERHAMGAMQGRLAAAQGGAVLDVIDDEGSGVQQLDERDETRGAGSDAIGEGPAQLDEAGAKCLAGAREKGLRGLDERRGPQPRGHGVGADAEPIGERAGLGVGRERVEQRTLRQRTRERRRQGGGDLGRHAAFSSNAMRGRGCQRRQRGMGPATERKRSQRVMRRA